MPGTRRTPLVCALVASIAFHAAPALANAYPGSAVLSVAADLGPGYFSSPFAPLISTSSTPNTLAAIATQEYGAAARTGFGINHALATADSFSNGALAVQGFSGWYDRITISGGTGTGTLQFSVQLAGRVTAGAHLGGAAFGLFASSVHPEQLAATLTPNVIAPQPWSAYLGAVQQISTFSVLASPYNDPGALAGLFGPSDGVPALPSGGGGGIPSLSPPQDPLGSNTGMGFPSFAPDLVVTANTHQLVNLALTGTLDFTYDEGFYLIGALGALVASTDPLMSFCAFHIGGCDIPPVDGLGSTTLDFFDSATLAGVVLPAGATFSAASGASYPVAAVPEPGEWAMLLAGLGLVAWRARRRT